MRIRTLVIAGTTAVVLAVAGAAVVPPPARAADVIRSVTVYTAGAEVTKPHYFPGLGPSAAGATFSFDTVKAGIAGQRICVSSHSVAGLDTSCDLAASGTVLSGLGNLGAYCGYSSGQGQVTKATINATNVLPPEGLYFRWVQSAGTLLPTLFFIGSPTGNAQYPHPIGFGSSQSTGASPGTCGFGGATNSFAVTGYSVLAVPVVP